ncbi:MAG: Ig-like domain-containing protein [Vicinamibacterales bacterium]
MPQPLKRSVLLVTFAAVVAALVGPPAVRQATRPLAPDGGDERMARERDGREDGAARERGRFDSPDEAVAFYVNRRTGPVLTRGANPTVGVRPLSAAAYLPALAHMRAMPRYAASTGEVMPSYEAQPDPGVGAAAPGGVLTTWANLGPTNQGGRTRSLLIDPGNPNVMYAGGVAGGVWKSTNAGASWTPLGQLSMANLAVVSLAFDPTTTNTIYAGTGEGVFNGDAIRGAGIFKSTDAGATWAQVASTNTSAFYYTMSVVVSPRDPQRLFAGTRSGLYRSTNGGGSWSQLVSNSTGCTQVVVQPAGASGYVFASCGNFSQGTIYRGTDDNASTFTGVLSLAGQGRSSLALAPSNQAILYVMSEQATNLGGQGLHGLHGIYRSTSNGDPGSFTTQVDGTVTPGTTAQMIAQTLLTNPYYAVGCITPNPYNQGWYDNVIAVDPVDPNRVWAGGIDLWRSDDGGVTWGTAGFWWFSKGNSAYHHADQHGIVFHPGYNGSTNKTMYALSDGGVERTDDARAAVNTTVSQICGSPVAGGTSWVDLNAGYVTTQFYNGAAYPDGQTYFGGLQDNGTQRGTTAGTAWSTISGGDGGYVAVDTRGDGTASNDVLFVEYTGLSISRSINGGGSFSSATSGISDSKFLFIAPFVINTSDRQQLWAGGQYIWRTTDQAASWTRASAAICGSGSVSALATHPLDGNRVLVGTSSGCYHYTTAALSAGSGTSWPTGSIASAYISWIAWDPSDVNVAYATLSRFGAATVYKSVNGGASWSPMMGSGATSLPQIPALTVVVNPDDSQQVFVGTDLGVFTSVDGGASWYLENSGFANTPVETLVFNDAAPRQLFAFTHGRGAWRVALANPNAPVAAGDSYGTASGTTLVVPAPGVLGNDNANGGGAMTAALAGAPAHGSITLSPNGGFSYTPAAGFAGTDAFTYTASTGSGTSVPATVSIAVAAAGTPLPPSNFRVSAMSGNLVSLAWTMPTSGAAPTGMLLEGGLTPGTTLGSIPLGAVPAVTLSLPTGTFYLRMRATTAGGTSAPSNEILVRVNMPVAPSAPANLLGTRNGSGVYLAWTPTFGGGAPVAAILDVTGTLSGSLPLGAGDTFSYPAMPAGTYTFTVRQTNAGGTSAPSNAVTLTFPGGCTGVPQAPANFLAYKSAGQLYLRWDPPTSGPAPTGYTLNVTGSFVGALPMSTRTLTVPGPPGTFTFSVAGTNPCGTGAVTAASALSFP